MRVCVVYFFGERLSYHRVCTHLFNQTVEREDDHRLLAELLAWPGLFKRWVTLSIG